MVPAGRPAREETETVAGTAGGTPEGGSSARIRIEEDGDRLTLVVDGAVISLAVDAAHPPSGYWAAMLPRRAPRTALILGLGGGTLAHLLTLCYPGVRIVGVDVDAELMEFARHQFRLDLPNLEVVVADAFAYVPGCQRGFDYIAVDLFRGYDFQRKALARPFLRRLLWMLEHGPSGEGEASFNLFKDRRTTQHIGRIARVLPVRRLDEVSLNVVVHCAVKGAKAKAQADLLKAIDLERKR